MPTLSTIIIVLLAATTAHADRWQSRRIHVVDYTAGAPVAAAANAWDAAVINPVVDVDTGYPAHCPPLAGAIAVCSGNFGSTYGYASTSLVRGRRGYIVGARVILNTYWPREFTPDENRYLLTHEFGHAFASLPHNTRPTSIMGGGRTLDAEDITTMNGEYGR